MSVSPCAGRGKHAVIGGTILQRPLQATSSAGGNQGALTIKSPAEKAIVKQEGNHVDGPMQVQGEPH